MSNDTQVAINIYEAIKKAWEEAGKRIRNGNDNEYTVGYWDGLGEAIEIFKKTMPK